MGGRAKGSSEDQYSFHPRVYTAARMSSLRQTPLTCSGHTRPVVFLAFSEINSDGIYYSISACKDGKPMLRQGDTGDWIGTFEGHKGAVWGVDVNKDATKAATGAADLSAKVWDALSGEEELTLQHKHIVKSVNFSNDKTVRMWDTATGGEVKRIDFDTPIGGVELAKEGDVLTVATGSKVIFYEAGTFEKMKEVSVSCPVYSASLNK